MQLSSIIPVSLFVYYTYILALIWVLSTIVTDCDIVYVIQIIGFICTIIIQWVKILLFLSKPRKQTYMGRYLRYKMI